jgi:hypothetical protein
MGYSDEDIVEKHPSYAVVEFSRCTGGGRRFFGSSVQSDSYIQLRIHQAERKHGSGYDRIGRTDLLPIIEVSFSPAQFAQLLTTMNVGEGTPGTIQYLHGKRVEQVPEAKTEAERSYEHLKKQLKDRMAGFMKKREEIRKILEDKATIGKADRKQLAGLLDTILMEISDNLPFYYQLVEEGVVKMVCEAKAEVDSFITAVVHRTGLEALRSQSPRIEFNKDSHLVEGRVDPTPEQK